jgi:hypothetical protein
MRNLGRARQECSGRGLTKPQSGISHETVICDLPAAARGNIITATSRGWLSQCRDCSDPLAKPAWQPTHRNAIDAAKRARATQPARHQSPANRTEGRCTGMARGRENRREEHQRTPRPPRPNQISRPMRRSSHGAQASGCPCRPAAASQVQPRMQGCTQSPVAGDREREPAHAAHGSDTPAQPGSVGQGVVAEYDPTDARRQLSYGN